MPSWTLSVVTGQANNIETLVNTTNTSWSKQSYSYWLHYKSKNWTNHSWAKDPNRFKNITGSKNNNQLQQITTETKNCQSHITEAVNEAITWIKLRLTLDNFKWSDKQ